MAALLCARLERIGRTEFLFKHGASYCYTLLYSLEQTCCFDTWLSVYSRDPTVPLYPAMGSLEEKRWHVGGDQVCFLTWSEMACGVLFRCRYNWLCVCVRVCVVNWKICHSKQSYSFHKSDTVFSAWRTRLFRIKKLAFTWQQPLVQHNFSEQKHLCLDCFMKARLVMLK